ncbi:unnamed protein product [Caenorhabditis brenneri]
MAAPVPVSLIPLYATFRIIILNLKNVTDIESSLKKLVLLNFNTKMAHDFALKKILKYTPVSEELKDLKNMVIGKVEKLEARNAETKEIMEEEAPEYKDSGSSSEDEDSDEEASKDEAYGSSEVSDLSDDEDSDEPPTKKPCYPSGPVKPTAQRTFLQVEALSKTAPKLPKLTIKVKNPFAKRPPQPLATTPRIPRSLPSASSHPLEPVAQRPKLTIKVANPFAKKSALPLVPTPQNPRSLPSDTSMLSATGQSLDEYLEKRRVERNDEKKENVKHATLTDPCIRRPGSTDAPAKKYTIPRKPVSSKPVNSATLLEEDFFSRKRTAPAKIVPKPKAKVTTDHPVPLMSIVLERPAWLSEGILNQY